MALVNARRARPAPRPVRTLTQKLGAIVLGFESIVVFLAGLTVYGLRVLPESIPSWWAIVGGAALAVVMTGVAGAITRPGAIVTGWVLQGLVLAASVLVPAIALVALIFGGMWAYATIVGARIDRQRPAGPPAHPHTESD
ncbi:DUF4233 domain-containing protein [Microbacterium sp. NPDC058345]|uniref:DUF4233 domain-containing protein n=1 Tax=Microbacterium sp. NPDC058345 TaxID=3346455 RepID=UPI003660CD1E